MQGVFRAAYVSSAFAAEFERGEHPSLLVTSISPGILFPLSLVGFGLLLGGTRTAGWGVALALVIGAILFPLGRFIIGNIWINVVSDAPMLFALGSIAAASRRTAPPEVRSEPAASTAGAAS